MNWYRIKTILILLFLAINIFLAAMLGFGALSASREAQKRISAAVSALEQSGIRVTAEIPRKTPRLGTLTLENLKTDPAAFADRLLGGKATRLGSVWQRDGKTVTMPERGFTYTSGADAVPAEKKSIKAMEKALESMGLSMEYAEGTLQDGAVRFVQKVNGAPLYECWLMVYPAADGTVARMEGVWTKIVESGKERTVIKGAEGALLSFLRESEAGSEVTAVDWGYAVLLAEDGYHSADAVPVWRVETADGKQYYYDAR